MAKNDSKLNDEQNTPPSRFEETQDEGLLPSPDDVSELHDQIATLNQALKEAQDKTGDYWDRLVRKEAELQNLQTRNQRELENTRKFAIDRFVSELIQVLDSFDQALTYGESEGLSLTHSVLLNVLEKHGVKPVVPEVGEAFNPAFHEAIAMQESAERQPNQIVTMVQKGYTLHDRLVRPARVVVSKT